METCNKGFSKKLNLFLCCRDMEIKMNNELLKDATVGLKKNIKEIDKEIKNQSTILEIIENKAVENAHNVVKARNKFEKAIESLKSDYRNFIILFLCSVIVVLFIVIF